MLEHPGTYLMGWSWRPGFPNCKAEPDIKIQGRAPLIVLLLILPQNCWQRRTHRRQAVLAQALCQPVTAARQRAGTTRHPRSTMAPPLPMQQTPRTSTNWFSSQEPDAQASPRPTRYPSRQKSLSPPCRASACPLADPLPRIGSLTQTTTALTTSTMACRAHRQCSATRLRCSKRHWASRPENLSCRSVSVRQRRASGPKCSLRSSSTASRTT